MLKALFMLGALAVQPGTMWVPLGGAPAPQTAPRVDPSIAPTTPATPAATDAAPIPEDLALLQGKRVMVGRLVLCVPNTFQPNLAYAGKAATVVGFKSNTSLSSINTAMLPPAARAMIEEQKRGGVLVLQFEDGTKLDTCGPQSANQLSPNLELAPGQKIEVSTAPSSAPPAPAANAFAGAPLRQAPPVAQPCPMAVIRVSAGYSFGHMLVDVLTTSEFQRQLDEAAHGGVQKHYLDVQVRNDSGKPVRAFEFSAAYSDAMGDESTSASFVSQNNKPIRAGDVFKTFAMDRELLMQNGRGDVTVFVTRVRFDDDTLWQDNGSRSCGLKAAFK